SLDVSANAVPSLPASSEPTPAGSGCPWYADGAEHATNPAVISSPVSATAQTCSVVNALRRSTQLILLGASPQSTSCLISVRLPIICGPSCALRRAFPFPLSQNGCWVNLRVVV